MKTIRRIFIGIGIAILLLLGLWLFLLNSMVKWIPPMAAVRMEPSRPILREEDVDPGSAFGLLHRACEELKKIEPRDEDRQAHDGERDRLAWEPWTDEAFPVTRRVLDDAGPALDLARRAAATSDAQVPTVTHPSDLVAYLPTTRDIARLLHASACRRIAVGDPAGAADDALTAFRIGNLVSRGGALINHLVDIACTGIGCNTLRLLSLRDGLPEDVVRSVLAELAAIETDLEPAAEVLRHEWLAFEAAIEEMYRDRGNALDPMSPAGRSALTSAFLALTGSTPRRTRATFKAVYSNLIELAENAGSSREIGAYVDGIVASIGPGGWPLPEDPAGAILIGMMLPSMVNYVSKVEARLVLLRATGLVLAIRRHEESTGEPPSSLAALGIPDLDRRFEDPFAPGSVLRYIVRDDGTWLVYSVGPNGIDDGGAYPSTASWFVASPSAPRVGVAGEDGDIVFPSDEPEILRQIHEAGPPLSQFFPPGFLPGTMPNADVPDGAP